MKNNEKLTVTILEIGDDFVWYRFYYDVTKELYSQKKSEIKEIVFKNGKKETSSKESKKPETNRDDDRQQKPDRNRGEDDYRDNGKQQKSDRNRDGDDDRDDYYRYDDRDNYYKKKQPNYNNENTRRQPERDSPYSQIHAGLVFPQDDFGDDSYNNKNAGGAAMGFNIGYKYYNPTSLGYLSFVFGFDVFYRMVFRLER